MSTRILFAVAIVVVEGCDAPRTSTAPTAPTPVAADPQNAPPSGVPAPPQPSSPLPAGAAPTAHVGELIWTFDADTVNGEPAGFSFGRTGNGRAGRWVVIREPGAGNTSTVLAQVDEDPTDYRFPVAVEEGLSMRDVRLSVRCRTVSGQVDQACGLVARYRDEKNYFLTRANALENNVRLYTVEDGERKQLASWSGTVSPNAWHTLRFILQGVHLEVFWDGQEVIDFRGSTFTDAGRVGVWTKADSVTYFDDLRAERF